MELPLALVLTLSLLHVVPATPQSATRRPCVLDGPVAVSEETLPPVPIAKDISKFFPRQDYEPGVLPDRDTTVHLRIRIDERGRVTSGCVVEDVNPKLADLLVGEAKSYWSYHPARLNQTDVAVAATVAVEVATAGRWRNGDRRRDTAPSELVERIWSSSDVSWLREIAASYAGAVRAMGRSRVGQPRMYRTAAFARLGELNTDESRRAAEEIEAVAAASTPTDDRFSATVWQHPAWHFGDAPVQMLARAEAPGGMTYGVVPGALLGTWELFLTWSRTPADRGSWARPRPIPGTLHRGVNNTFLRWRGEGWLEFTYEQQAEPPRGIMEFRPEGERPAADPGPRTWAISLNEVLADADGDGWTDLEEARLGLDPRNKDTDGDGLDDGADTCPNNPVSWRDEVAEDQSILRRALFASFGLSGSRNLLLVERGTPVHLRGYQGPVIYGRERATVKPGTFGSFGGVFVSWEIRRAGEEATVSISDWEGTLAGGGQNVYLRKQAGRWYVIGVQTTWIS